MDDFPYFCIFILFFYFSIFILLFMIFNFAVDKCFFDPGRGSFDREIPGLCPLFWVLKALGREQNVALPFPLLSFRFTSSATTSSFFRRRFRLRANSGAQICRRRRRRRRRPSLRRRRVVGNRSESGRKCRGGGSFEVAKCEARNEGEMKVSFFALHSEIGTKSSFRSGCFWI